MKNILKIAILLGLLSFYITNAFSQISYGGEPLSFKLDVLQQEIDHVIITAPDQVIIQNLKEQECKTGGQFNVAVPIDTEICNNTAGTTEILEDGTLIWRIKISSPGAMALAIFYDHFYIPQGGKLFLYNENRKQVVGSFDHRTNPRRSNLFSTQIIEGETTYLEYIQQPGVTENFKFVIGQVSYIFRGVEGLIGYYRTTKNPPFGSSDPCQVNINCPEGNNWQTEKRSVATFFNGGGICTGSMVNNTAFDGTPYFLTADHCGGTQGNMHQWQYYFHYEAPACNNPPSQPTYETVVGADFISRGPMSGGSDFLLQELHITPQEAADLELYYNGWDLSTTGAQNGVSIHHPSGDIKKISTFTSQLTTTNFPGGLTGAFWQVNWASTVTDHGVTESGSSGSPIYNGTNKLLVGTLTGGTSYCNTPNAPDQYGKFYVHWEDNGPQDNRQLRPWLDPQNTGQQQIEGFDPLGGGAPAANFVGDPLNIPVGGQVQFTDQSLGSPTSWQWTFQGGNPPTSPNQNPTVTYNTAGSWNVTLTATNAEGEDTETKESYITVFEEGELIANFIAQPTTLSAGTNSQFIDQSSGPPTYWEWEFQGGVPATSTAQSPQINYPDPGIYSVTLTVSDGIDTDQLVRVGYIVVTPPGVGDLNADFIVSNNQIIQGQCVSFYDQSTGSPETWNWSFPGGTPLTSGSQNPSNICYAQPGWYDVCLQITKGTNSHTYCCQDCIEVLPDPTLPKVDFVANQTTVPVGGVVLFSNLSENGPFSEWSWTFHGGTPHQVNLENPGPIAYHQYGQYTVELRGKPVGSNQIAEIKHNYINVVAPATGPPKANFEANYTFISPGETINFIDLSTGDPYNWAWEFEGAEPPTSNMKNPQGVLYEQEGMFKVKLTVSNNFGVDELTKEHYILVAAEDTCTQPPIVKFTADNRLITSGGTIGFINQSLNNPSTFSWFFEGGTPSSSSERNPSQRIKYNNPGIYKVRLTANNACGSEIVEKNQYIYVFSGAVGKYCDTLSNIKVNENYGPYTIPQLGWGYLAGHNGENIRGYADYFETYTFSHIEALLVPVELAVYGNYQSQVRFYIWDGNTDKPENVLADKRVFIRDLIAGQTNVIKFDEPVQVNGPFYIGYTISYTPGTIHDHDNFIVGIANPRGNNPAVNTMFVQQGGEWYSANQRYGFSSSLPIKPVTCLVDIQEFLSDYDIDVYPNPSTGIVNVSLGDLEYRQIEINVYDMLGRKVDANPEKVHYGEYSIDLSGRTDGLYILKIRTDRAIFNKKLLINK